MAAIPRWGTPNRIVIWCGALGCVLGVSTANPVLAQPMPGPAAEACYRAFAAAASAYLLEQETTHLVFNKDTYESFSCLGEGWVGQGVRKFMASDKDFWARSRLATLEITVLRPRDLNLTLEMRPAYLEDAGAQRVEVSWNQTRLGVIEFDLKRGWGTESATFSVPRAIQKRGANRITFVSRFALSRGAFEEGEDKRNHAFSLLSLDLTDAGAAAVPGPPPDSPELVLDGETVLQPPGTLLKYPVRLPASGYCRFEMEPPETSPVDAAWSVSLRADDLDGPTDRKLFANGSPQPFAYDLTLFQGKVVEFVFDTTGGALPATVRWRAPRILAAAPEAGVTYAPLDAGFKTRNVILIICDAMRASGLGCYGYERDTTPSIDALAAEGVRFSRAYAPASYTYSSSWSLVTSLYPFQHNAPEQPLRVADSAPRLAQVLRQAGIYAGCISQQHWISPKFGIADYFDEWAEAYETVEILNAGGHPDLLTVKARDFLQRSKEKPFFLYLHYRPPHELYIAASPYWDHFTVDPTGSVKPTADFMRGVKDSSVALNREQRLVLRARYDENLLSVDAEIGKLRDMLTELGLAENTLVIVTADHGEAFLEHDFLSHGQTLYEEVTHVPLVLWGAGVTKAFPALNTMPVSTVCLYPTICDVLGAAAPESIAGRSLVRPWQALDAGDVRAYAQNNWLIATHTWDPLEAFWWERFKLIRDTMGRRLEVYDLERDPEERRDLVPLRPVLTDYLLAHALSWRRHAATAVSGPATESQLEQDDAERRQLEALGYLN